MGQAIGLTMDVIHLAKVSAKIVFNSVPARGFSGAGARGGWYM